MTYFSKKKGKKYNAVIYFDLKENFLNLANCDFFQMLAWHIDLALIRL